jgi:hypothetical protein
LRFALDIAVACLVAVLTGVSSAWLAVNQAPLFDPLTIGRWTAWPAAGSPDADPYDLAAATHSPALPLGSGEGLAFTAVSDDRGGALDGACTYEVTGDTPAARLWTLTAYGRSNGGTLMPNPAQRFGISSREILRRTDGTFTIVVAPRVQPGNWLPVSARTAFTLVLRLYDTPLTSAARPSGLIMPAVRRVACS